MPEPRLKRVGIVAVAFGENVTVVEPANLFGCTIGEGAFIGRPCVCAAAETLSRMARAGCVC
jgi:carbonic anhydrase/acetyltransferase-like protein (isoleucine patch superfamily)